MHIVLVPGVATLYKHPRLPCLHICPQDDIHDPPYDSIKANKDRERCDAIIESIVKIKVTDFCMNQTKRRRWQRPLELYGD